MILEMDVMFLAFPLIRILRERHRRRGLAKDSIHEPHASTLLKRQDMPLKSQVFSDVEPGQWRFGEDEDPFFRRIFLNIGRRRLS